MRQKLMLAVAIIIIGTVLGMILRTFRLKQDQLKPVTIEQLRNVRAGDFVKFNGGWYSVKMVSLPSSKNTNLWIKLEDSFALENQEYFKLVDSIVYAPRDMSGDKWQQMALRYCATH